jgi:hypothetical protein
VTVPGETFQLGRKRSNWEENVPIWKKTFRFGRKRSDLEENVPIWKKTFRLGLEVTLRGGKRSV